ncbi:hypothetical protein ABZY93_22030 [Streptomyces smyrnaeus]|uniref:hypothetical protein n=1 Tax=Streptomyces smyrnaeus TaxID=1387713 RepID=UPI0033BD25FD
MKIEVTVCNVCRTVGRPAESYTIGRGGVVVEMDLCEEHAAPIEALLDQREEPAEPQAKTPGEGPPAKDRPAEEPPEKEKPAEGPPAKRASAKKGGTKRRSRKVVSLEEIEKMKQNQG